MIYQYSYGHKNIHMLILHSANIAMQGQTFDMVTRSDILASFEQFFRRKKVKIFGCSI